MHFSVPGSLSTVASHSLGAWPDINLTMFSNCWSPERGPRSSPRALSSLAGILKPSSFSMRALAFARSEEHTSELQSRLHLVCRLLLEKKKKQATDSSYCQ